MMLAVLKGLGFNSVSPVFQRLGSCPACNRVVEGVILSLGACTALPLATQFSFYKLMLILSCVQTLASSTDKPNRELGVVFGLKFQPYGLLMYCNGFFF